MQATRIMPNLRVADVDAAKTFYTDYLGLSTEEFNMGWVARYTSPDGREPRTTWKQPMRKRRNSATRSRIRSRQSLGGCGDSSSEHPTAISSTS